jgi:hypothetical protein
MSVVVRSSLSRVLWLFVMMLAVVGAGLLGAARVARANNIILEWTAPGDDSTYGRAAEYDLRWSLHANQFPSRFFTARRISIAAPSDPGTIEHLVIPDLPESTTVFFALRTRDRRGNWSRVSNVLAAQQVAGVGDGANVLSFSEGFPVPAHVQAMFTLTLPSRGPALVEAIDVSGRLVRSLQRGELAPGRHTLTWDLRDDAGNRSQPGVYFVRARAGGQKWVRRVVVLR